MRKILYAAMLMILILGLTPVPGAAAAPTDLDGPTSFWISDPDGDGGIDQLAPVAGATGRARVNDHGATIRVTATGLERGHTYTMWVVYFSDQTACSGDCGGDDLGNLDVRAGVLFGDGKIAGGTGRATFTARLNTGAGGDALGPPPPPFAFAAYQADPDNEFHVVLRSHGPKVPGGVGAQIHEFGGGCVTEVGPGPGEVGDFPVPSAPGECGDVQVHVFQ